MANVMPRVMEIVTPLGDDVLLFHVMSAREEMSRLFESGGATESRIAEMMTDLKTMETQGPARLRRDVDALDSLLTPVQQAKLRILEAQVERRIRGLMARIRSESPASRRNGPAPRKGSTQQDDTTSP